MLSWSRVAAIAALLPAALLLLYHGPEWAAGSEPPAEPVVVTVEVDRTIGGRGVERWREIALERDRTARKQANTIRGLRRTLRHKPSSLEALRLAAIAHGVPFSTLYRKASCESTGRKPTSPPTERTLNPLADNPDSTASGLLQFLWHPSGRGSTWHTTPYAAESVWSPYANALAAAWMHRVGRAGEWVCR